MIWRRDAPRSHWKSWGSERKIRAGVWVEMKRERLEAFLLIPSIFQEMMGQDRASTELSV